MFLAADILGLGHSISSFGETLALAIIFLGIGILANLLIVYALAAAKEERDENLARMDAFDATHPHAFDGVRPADTTEHTSVTPAHH